MATPNEEALIKKYIPDEVQRKAYWLEQRSLEEAAKNAEARMALYAFAGVVVFIAVWIAYLKYFAPPFVKFML